MTEPVYVALEAGDPAPHFSQAASAATFNLSNLGGGLTVHCNLHVIRRVVWAKPCWRLSAGSRICSANTRFLAVTVDRDDAARLKDAGLDVILDFDGKVARRYGAIPAEPPPHGTPIQFRPRFIVLDRRLRVHAAMLNCAPMAAMRTASSRRSGLAGVGGAGPGAAGPDRAAGFSARFLPRPDRAL